MRFLGRRALAFIALGAGLLAAGAVQATRPDIVWMRGGHNATAIAAVPLPDGQTLASIGDTTLKFFRIADGMLLRSTGAFSLGVSSLAASPDGLTVAVGGTDSSASGGTSSAIKLFRVSDGTLLRTLQGLAHPPNELAFSPDGTRLASAAYNANEGRLWRISDGTVLSDLSYTVCQPSCNTYNDLGFSTIAFSPDGSLLAAGRSAGGFLLYRIADAATFHFGAGALALAFSPDGTRIAAVDGAGARVYNVADACPVGSSSCQFPDLRSSAVPLMQVGGFQATSVRFSPDGSRLAVGADELVDGLFLPRVKLWSTSDWSLIRSYQPNDGSGRPSVAFSIDGAALFSAHEGIRMWSVADGSLTASVSAFHHALSAIAFSPDRQILATAEDNNSGGSWANSVRLWRASDGSLLRTLTHSGLAIPCRMKAAFSPDGQHVATTCGFNQEGDTRLWRVADGALLGTFAGSSTAVTFSPDSQRLAIAFPATSGSIAVELRSVADGALVRTLSHHSSYQSAASLAFSPDGQHLALGYSGAVALLRVADGALDKLLSGGPGDPGPGGLAVAFSLDGATLFSGGTSDGYKPRVVAWRVADASVLADYPFAASHASWIRTVALSPDLRFIATGADDATVKFWRLADAALLATWDEETGGVHPGQVKVTAAAFSADGLSFAYGRGDATVVMASSPAVLSAGGTPPAAPTRLRGYGVHTQVALYWDGHSPLTIYRVYRATASSGPFSEIGTTTNSNFADLAVSANTTYHYRVTGFDAGGESAPASIAITTPTCIATDCISPSIPANVQAAFVAPSQVQISWSPSSDASGISQYTVNRGVPGQPGEVIGSSVTTAYTDSAIVAGMEYYYFVTACDNAGNCSIASPGMNVFTGTPPTPGFLNGGSAHTQVQLWWGWVSGASGYRVYRATSSGGPFTDLGLVTATTFVDTGVAAGTTYYYRVTALSSTLESAPVSATVTTQACSSATDCVSPSMPANLAATVEGPMQVSLTWSASSDASGIRNYYIGRCNPGGACGSLNGNVVATSFTDFSVVPGSSYSYYVGACDTAGNCSLAAIVQAITPAASGAAPAAPSALSASVSGQNVTFTWNAGTGATRHNLYVAKAPGVTRDNYLSLTNGASLVGVASPFTQLNVPVGTWYAVATALNDSGESVESNEISIEVTLPTTALSISGPRAVREGGTASFAAFAVKSDGSYASVTPTWSVAGPASIDASGQLTAGAVTGGQLATVSASYFDAASGLTQSASYSVLIQEGQDAWSISGEPGQGGHVRAMPGMGANSFAAAVYGGGIYRTYDNGASWVPRMNGLGSLLVRTVRNIGTGTWLAALDGAGVYRSSDSMGSWAPSNAGLGCTAIRGFSVTGGVVYAATQGCGVYKSTDNGLSWSSANGAGMPNGGAGVVVSTATTTTTPGEMWAPTSQGIFHTTDGGASWSAKSSGITGPNGPSVYSVVVGSGYLLAIVEGAGVFKSSDNGASWAPSNSGLPALHMPFGMSSTHSGARRYVPVDGHGLYVSTDNGASWSPFGTSASAIPQPVFIMQGTGTRYWALTFAGVYSTDDEGQTWTARNAGLPGGYTTNTTTNPANALEVFATADTVYRSADGGTTWARADNGLRGYTYGGVVLYHPTQANTLYASTNSQGVYRSSDGGASWAPMNAGLPNMTAQTPNLRFDAGGRAYVALAGRGIYRSTGGAWSALNNGLAGQALTVNSVDVSSATLYAATNDGLYVSTNDGASWAKAGWSDSNPGIPVNNVRVDGAGGAVYWSVYATDAHNVPHPRSGLYRSIDSGATATQLLSGKRVRNFRVVRNGSQVTLWAINWSFPNTTDWGVIRSSDGGVTWNAVNAGTANNSVSTLGNSFEIYGGQLVRIATRGGGVASFTAAAAPELAPPPNVGAALSGGNITVSWDAVSGATGYKIYMANAAGVTKANYASLSGGHAHLNVTSPYTHANPAPGTYYLVVTASNGTSESAESAQASVTVAADTTPDAFSFAPQLEVAPSTVVTSNAITVGGINAAAAISVTGGEYSIGCSGAFTAAAGSIANGQTVCVRHTSSASPSTTTTTQLTVGGVAAAFSSTTGNGNPVLNLSVEQGWNLVGNALNVTLDVAAIFGQQGAPVAGITDKVFSVWKWDAVNQQWAFFSPFLSAAQNASYAANNGFTLLGSIAPGEGYWVNAFEPVTLPPQSGSRFVLNAFAFAALPSGWNLIAVAPSTPVAPYELNAQMSLTPPAPGVVPQNFYTLWQWEPAWSKWWFYSPLLEASGGRLLDVKNYAEINGHLDFETVYPPRTEKKRLGLGGGFWINKP